MMEGKVTVADGVHSNDEGHLGWCNVVSDGVMERAVGGGGGNSDGRRGGDKVATSGAHGDGRGRRRGKLKTADNVVGDNRDGGSSVDDGCVGGIGGMEEHRKCGLLLREDKRCDGYGRLNTTAPPI
jgi:hypothetical protein